MKDLPDKNTALPNTEQGMYLKYHVYRADGTDRPGGKHHGCQLFVLDVTHDPYAKAALQAYAQACKATQLLIC